MPFGLCDGANRFWYEKHRAQAPMQRFEMPALEARVVVGMNPIAAERRANRNYVAEERRQENERLLRRGKPGRFIQGHQPVESRASVRVAARRR